MIDFGQFRKPDQRGRPTDPREIFKRRPSGEGAANDLWQGQAEALGSWFEKRANETLILLNTGAGKTIIGLLIAQSYVNQGIQNVVYACSTIDLMHQTAREARQLGLQVTRRFSRKFDNDLFNQGRTFCITTYASVLNPLTVFRRQLKPGAIIFDDAHVANRLIRDGFSLRIEKTQKPDTFLGLLEIVRPAFIEANLRMEFQSAIKEDGPGSVLLVPPVGFFDLSDKVTTFLDGQIKEDETRFYFPWLLLRDHIKYCACLIRNDIIEIVPPFLPTLTLPAFARDVKRVYLSATLTAKADFTRVFGHIPQNAVAPNVDAGDGERLFLFASRFENGKVDRNIIGQIMSRTKVLIAVPSRIRASHWGDFAVLADRDTFTEKLDAFRRASTGGFILAGRFDGIDLPGSQCRVMVIDGLPTGGSLIEQFLFERLQMDHFLANALSVRLTQLLGRIIRGRRDFGFFIIADRTVENWLKNERNRSLMPELLRRQLFLSEAIESEMPGAANGKTVMEIMNKVLGREQDWVDFYRDNINDLDVPEVRLQENEEEDRTLTDAGRREVRFATKLWDNFTAGARNELEPILGDVAVYDPILAGWYSIWIGIAYYAEGQTDAAYDMFDEARRRTGASLPLPRRTIPVAQGIETASTFVEDALRENSNGDVIRINDRVAKLKIAVADAFARSASHRKCEEAIRIIGASLGFNSTRPCNDYGLGPDNLWIDVRSKEMIAIELKADKDNTSVLTKDDVGQGFNHLEWVKKQYPGVKLHGLIFLTPCRRVSDRSSPSEEMYFGSQEKLRTLWEEFLGIIERIRPRTPLERVIEAKKIGELPEWACSGIFKRLIEKTL
jgi:hypothetical protein